MPARSGLLAAMMLLQLACSQRPADENTTAVRARQPAEDTTTAIPAAEDSLRRAAAPSVRGGGASAAYVAADEVLDLSAEVAAEAYRDAVSAVENPIHPGRARLQEQMRRETPAQTFARLVDNDNFRMLIPSMGSVPFSPGCYAADRKIVRKMNRVRKLVADGRKDPRGVSALLTERLEAMAATFPSAYREFTRTLSGPKAASKLTLEELPDVQKQRLQSTVAVYVLSEIGACDALPVLAKLSARGRPDLRSANFAGSCQVNPTFLLYGMHRLLQAFPESGLSEGALKARRAYLAAAGRAGIPDPETMTVPAWDAMYHEDDYRRTLLRQGFHEPGGQPVIELTVFPPLRRLSVSRVQRLLKRMRVFVREAFCE